MEKIWEYTFKDELSTDPSEHPVVLTESLQNPKANRERMIQIMFETFNVPYFYSESQELLSFVGARNLNGMLCNIGHQSFQTVQMDDGYLVEETYISQDMGGESITLFLQEMLKKREYIFSTPADLNILREIKEQRAYVALNYEDQIREAKTSSWYDIYNIPYGDQINITEERFKCAELLFNPKLNDLKCDGIDKTIFNSIMKSEDHFHKDLFNSIILSGASSCIEGLEERLEKEMKNLAPPGTNVNIISNKNSYYQVWAGACIMSSLQTFPQVVFTHEKYNEIGPSIIHQNSSVSNYMHFLSNDD